MPEDSVLASLLSVSQDPSQRALAARYAPTLRFDSHEPFLPIAVGYTIFNENGTSPSFRQGHTIDLASRGHPSARFAIEYAIWWDWDIGHLYELEHVWVYVDEHGGVVRCAASWHGELRDMRLDGRITLEGDHAALYSEPGKHAFAPTPDWFKERRRQFKRSETSDLAGIGGVLIARFIQDKVKPTPLKARLVHTYLSQLAFEPSWEFSQACHLSSEMLVPWTELCDWMPVRLNHILDRLAREIPLSDYRFLRIGHRGAAAHAPDNTLLGIRTAAFLGADLVEIDVHQTGDGRVVLSHEDYLTDERGTVRFIRDSALADLQKIDLGRGECIATLDQAIEVCKQEQLGAYIELKDGRCVAAVAEIISKQRFGEWCMVASFRPDWVAEIKALLPKTPTSVLFSSVGVDPVILARAARADFVHPCWERFAQPSSLLTPDWVARVRNADLGIICWHEERVDEIAALGRVGVDGICSDAPDLLVNRRMGQ